MRYATAAAFRSALEQRLRDLADGNGARISRLRKQVAFDRLLTRLVAVAPEGWLVKGGFALQLRLPDRSRTTQDVDLAWRERDVELVDTLLQAVEHDAGDFFTLGIERTTDPVDRLGGTHRFRVTAALAGRQFETFLLDVGQQGDAVDPELLPASDLLGFAGLPRLVVPVLPVAVQAAEKLHAYTRVYEGGRASTRTKDLVDLVLISRSFALRADDLASAINEVFAIRATHEPPGSLPAPPGSWRLPYARLASEVGLQEGLDAGHAQAAAFIDPILATRSSGTWDPATGSWSTPGASRS